MGGTEDENHVNFFLLLIMLSNMVFASQYQDMTPDEIYRELNSSYISSVDMLPPINETALQPDINWQQAGNIKAWIDIVGFKNTAKIGNVSYISGNPADNTIVRYDVSIGQLKSRVVKDTRLNCYWCIFGSIAKSIDVRQNGNQTIAYLNVTLNWHEVIVNSGSIVVVPYTDYSTFADVEQSPLIYTTPSTQNLTIEQYGGLYQKNLLRFQNLSELITAYTISTRNGSVERRRFVGIVDYKKGIPFMNVTAFSSWQKTGTGIYHFMNDVISENVTEFNVKYQTAFGIEDIATNITTIKMQQSEIKPFVFQLLYIVGAFFIGIYLMNKSIQNGGLI